MKYLVTPLIAAYILTGALQLHPREDEQTSTVVSRRRIQQTLSQKLPEATKEFGGGLFDGTNYRIGALRRTVAGEVEVHQNDTDILYVISGAATLITGGEVIGRREISAVEARGTSIRNGSKHELRAGHIAVIPRRQPHWFQKVSGEISYVVTKVQ